MKFNLHKLAIGLSAMFLLVSTVESGAFALLGPVQSWMQTTNDVIVSGDIGGPMCISNEYRWNVPMVTYGFDKSFLDFFGSNGVAAVESVIQTLNDLPTASQIVPANYPFDSQRVNFEAQALSIYDLKSETLSLLLEHMGLAEPTRYIFVLKQWNPVFISDPSESQWPDGTIPNYIVQRNFDPQTLLPSVYVNQTLYAGVVINEGSQNLVEPVVVDSFENTYTAVADFNLNVGGFYTGLTYDDVGGLAYLLSTNNVNYENLLPGVLGAGANSNSFVNGAWRPGVDKITFIPQPVDSQSGAFLPTTNYFTDSYITNGILQQQQMARIISQPDFLFSAGDITSSIPAVFLLSRTGTTNWLNNATANGNTNGAGPGVIQPQVQIVFNKLGQQFESDDSDQQVSDQPLFWASFDGSTNAPVIYPIPQTATNQLTVRMWLIMGNTVNNFVQSFQRSFEWKPTSATGVQFTLQTSTNLMDWTNLFTIPNDGSVCTYFNFNPASPSRFYRLIQQ
jgi:hypothetical protein